MIPSIYHEDVMGKLEFLPSELIEFCNREKMMNYNISKLAGILFYTTLIEDVKNVLEIGSGWCLSTIAFASAVKLNNGKVLSFDLYDRSNILDTVPTLKPYITQINVNSYKTNITYPLISKYFDDIDLLFIDGEHTYSGVKRDFDNYSHLLHKGSIIILHDIALCDPNKGLDSIEVHKFWDEIDTNKYDKFPFYASNGLGLIRKK